MRCAINAVVVDLPLVPVMATNGASGAWRRRSRQNNSISPITSTPASRAISTLQCGLGWVSGAPGVRISAAKFAHDTVRRSAVVKPASAACASRSPPSSPATTLAPPARSAWQLARPEPPRPNTATVLPANEVTGIMTLYPSFRGSRSENPESRDSGSPLRVVRNDVGNASTPSSPQLQGRKAGQRQHHRNDPEPDHDLRLGPALLFEMVMQWRHAEDALAGELERGDLHDHRDSLQHEQPTNHREHDLVLHRDRDRAEHAAERQRTRVSHEDRSRRRIEPEKAEPSAEHRATEYGEFAGAGDIVDLQIIGEHRVTRQIGDHAETCRGDHHRHDGETIEAVGQIDRVAGTDDDEGAEDHEEPA